MKLKWRQGFRFGVANTFDNSKAFDDVNANNNRGSLDFTLYSVYSNYFFLMSICLFAILSVFKRYNYILPPWIYLV